MVPSFACSCQGDWMADDTTDAPGIPIEAVPVELEVMGARCNDTRGEKGRVYELSKGMVTIGLITLVVGAVTALVTTRTPAFGSDFFRAGTLAVGLAFVGAWVAFTRMRRSLGS